MKKFLLSILFGTSIMCTLAQEKFYAIEDISVIYYGDGRFLFRQTNEDKTPLEGSLRIISGYSSEYILAEF